jgi:hypothetical protein
MSSNFQPEKGLEPMTASFNTIELMGDKVLVQGTDRNNASGRMVVDASQWNLLREVAAFDAAVADHGRVVEEFFAPIVQSSERVKALGSNEPDPLSYIETQAAVDGVKAVPAVRKKLSDDSIILRVLEQGQVDLLVWVAEDQLVVAKPSTAPAVPVGDDE